MTSLAVSGVVLFRTWGLLRNALHLALDGVPKTIETEKVRAFLLALPDVAVVHDLHIWAMSTAEVALTAHLEASRIAHVTVQIAPSEYRSCARDQAGAL